VDDDVPDTVAAVATVTEHCLEFATDKGLAKISPENVEVSTKHKLCFRFNRDSDLLVTG
jgi:hypothetical protein